MGEVIEWPSDRRPFMTEQAFDELVRLGLGYRGENGRRGLTRMGWLMAAREGFVKGQTITELGRRVLNEHMATQRGQA
jgi:hypothetical protein